MSTRLVPAVICLAVLATLPVAAKEKTKPAEPETVSCSGVYGPDSSEALVIETFGAENVETGLVYGPEGMEYIATTVFKDDADRRLEFGWWDEENRTRLSYVDLSFGQAAPLGLRLGMSVAEVEAINGQPFTIGGFWWDYGGYSLFDTGAIGAVPDCFISIRFSPMVEETGDLDLTPVAGEVQVPSSEPLLEELDVRVNVLTLSYAMPEELMEADPD